MGALTRAGLRSVVGACRVTVHARGRRRLQVNLVIVIVCCDARDGEEHLTYCTARLPVA